MERRYPYYYKMFKCTAGNCTDSCCMHWEIDIDEESLAKYQKMPGAFGDRLRDSIYINEEGAHFKMDRQERCVFLNSQGLCDMILNIGEEHLCSICTEHPRFYDDFSFGYEVGVGLCCEAAAALILDDSISDEICCEPESDSEDISAEEAALFDRRRELLNYTYTKEAFLHGTWGTDFFTRKSIEALTSLFLELEIISPKWRELITKLQQKGGEVLDAIDGFFEAYPPITSQINRLMHYFVYRYFMTARFEEDTEWAAEDIYRFCLNSAGTILLLDIMHWQETEAFTMADQINICKLYSQEIEYDPDNVIALEEF